MNNQEHNNFSFLLNVIPDRNKISSNDSGPTADEDKLQQRTKEIRKIIKLSDKPNGQLKPKKTETTTTTKKF